MKEKQSKCSIDIFLPMTLLLVGLHLFFSLHDIRDIYRRYFLRNIPIMSLVDYKEKIEIYTKYLEKKSNWVGHKYLRLHRWISQVGSVHYARKGWFIKVIHMVWKWNLNCEVAHVCLQVVSQADFATTKFLHSLVRLSSNGHNFFVSTLIHALFKALDFWLPKVRNDI